MNMDYAEAVVKLEDEVDEAVNRAERSGLSIDEIVSELRRIAQGWSDNH